MVLTHAHEDYIGALPHLLRRFRVPVFGSEVTLAFARRRLHEASLIDGAELRAIAPRRPFELWGPQTSSAIIGFLSAFLCFWLPSLVLIRTVSPSWSTHTCVTWGEPSFISVATLAKTFASMSFLTTLGGASFRLKRLGALRYIHDEGVCRTLEIGRSVVEYEGDREGTHADDEADHGAQGMALDDAENKADHNQSQAKYGHEQAN